MDATFFSIHTKLSMVALWIGHSFGAGVVSTIEN